MKDGGVIVYSHSSGNTSWILHSLFESPIYKQCVCIYIYIFRVISLLHLHYLKYSKNLGSVPSPFHRSPFCQECISPRRMHRAVHQIQMTAAAWRGPRPCRDAEVQELRCAAAGSPLSPKCWSEVKTIGQEPRKEMASTIRNDNSNNKSQ